MSKLFIFLVFNSTAMSFLTTTPAAGRIVGGVSAETLASISRFIFGHIQGNGERSGMKCLKGRTESWDLNSFYPDTLERRGATNPKTGYWDPKWMHKSDVKERNEQRGLFKTKKGAGKRASRKK